MEEEDPLACLTDTERGFLTRICREQILPTLEALARGGTAFAFNHWVQIMEEQREKERLIALEIEVKRIMQESIRKNRSPIEKETLKTYLSSLTCIPAEISSQQMDIMCNDIDSVNVVGKSILFLQGDFGNVYYIIARGEVQLYLEKSKDKEMEIGREFGNQRGVPYEGDFDNDIPNLGINIVTLKAGQGFGEFAILSTTGKLRMCAAVASTDDTFLFVLDAPTYNSVLRQHHYRSKQLTTCTALLQSLPIFNLYSYSKLSNIAYGMKSRMYSNGSILVKANSNLNIIMIVNTGHVKVIHPKKKIEHDEEWDGVRSATETMEMRLPKLAHAILGRGSIIGQEEITTETNKYSMTYVSCSHDCEVFEMPINLYKECCLSAEAMSNPVTKALTKFRNDRSQTNTDRVERSAEAMRQMALAHAQKIDDKAQLVRLLPLLIDGISLDPPGKSSTSGNGNGSGSGDGTKNNKFSKNSTAADIIALTQTMKPAGIGMNTTGGGGGASNWFDSSGVPYGYDPSVSREDNMSTSDLFATYRQQQTGDNFTSPAGTPRTPTRPGGTPSKIAASPNQRSMANSRGSNAHIRTPGKNRNRALAPSPQATKKIYASANLNSISAPNTPRA
jgi:CRP-like cAMP-binding protein